jgi:cytochrome c oxidase assembly factor CtaG
MIELVLDAVPGIVLRLHTHPVTDFFAHRALHSWSPGRMHDQHIAGAIVWCVAEVIDLPFLLLVFHRWQRVDAREAADVDAVLDAERIARAGAEADVESSRDAPWWLNDPAMQERFRRGG